MQKVTIQCRDMDGNIIDFRNDITLEQAIAAKVLFENEYLNEYKKLLISIHCKISIN